MEVKKIIDAFFKEAVVIVKKQRDILDNVAEKLLVKETLEREDFEKIVGEKSSK